MLYNSCVVKYSKIDRAYGAFDAALCTTSWAPVLTNSKFGRVFLLTYGWFSQGATVLALDQQNLELD